MWRVFLRWDGLTFCKDGGADLDLNDCVTFAVASHDLREEALR